MRFVGGGTAPVRGGTRFVGGGTTPVCGGTRFVGGGTTLVCGGTRFVGDGTTPRLASIILESYRCGVRLDHLKGSKKQGPRAISIVGRMGCKRGSWIQERGSSRMLLSLKNTNLKSVRDAQ